MTALMTALRATPLRAHPGAVAGRDIAVCRRAPADRPSLRLARRLGAGRDRRAATVDGPGVRHRHPAPARLCATQRAEGLAAGISTRTDPLLTAKGRALD